MGMPFDMKYLSQAPMMETFKKFELVFIECPSLARKREGRQNTYFIHNDFRMQLDTMLGPHTFIKCWKRPRRPFNAEGDSPVEAASLGEGTALIYKRVLYI